MDRIAGAPISWGVCEIDGWGPMLDARRVLREMTGLGLRATEQGSPGFLPDDLGELKELIAEYDVSIVGDFVPLPMHDDAQQAETLQRAERMAARLQSLGATTFVSCAIADVNWSDPHRMDDHELKTLAETLDRIEDICAAHDLVHTLHPHLGTMVEGKEDILRVSEASKVKWTLDTGHLTLGGYDPTQFAKDFGDRVSHVHLKDVDRRLADKIISRELTLLEATRQKAWLPFGKGNVPISEIVTLLEGSGYRGWYVLECDTAIVGPVPPEGSGPVEDMRICVDYMNQHFPNGLAQPLGASGLV